MGPDEAGIGTARDSIKSRAAATGYSTPGNLTAGELMGRARDTLTNATLVIPAKAGIQEFKGLPLREVLINSILVIPAKAGIQEFKGLQLGAKSKYD